MRLLHHAPKRNTFEFLPVHTRQQSKLTRADTHHFQDSLQHRIGRPFRCRRHKQNPHASGTGSAAVDQRQDINNDKCHHAVLYMDFVKHNERQVLPRRSRAKAMVKRNRSYDLHELTLPRSIFSITVPNKNHSLDNLVCRFFVKLCDVRRGDFPRHYVCHPLRVILHRQRCKWDAPRLTNACISETPQSFTIAQLSLHQQLQIFLNLLRKLPLTL